MKRLRYYIPYFHSTGTGYSVIDRNEKIESIDDVLEVTKYIETINSVEKVIIISWTELSI